MTNHESQIIDLTESFSLVDHSSLANTIIELDETFIVVPDSPEGSSRSRMRSTQRVNKIKPRENRSNRQNISITVSGRNSSSTQTTSNNNIHLRTNPPKSKIRKTAQTSHVLNKSDEGSGTNHSPIKIGHCPICFETIGRNPLASTNCGHVFCAVCLEKSLSMGKKCPTCRKVLRGSNAYHRLFLPGD